MISSSAHFAPVRLFPSANALVALAPAPEPGLPHLATGVLPIDLGCCLRLTVITPVEDRLAGPART